MKIRSMIHNKRIAGSKPPAKRAYTLLLVFFLSLFLFTDTFAAIRTFTGTGNFGTAANWNGGTLPAVGDDLRINGLCRVENNALTYNVAYGNLTIGFTSAGTLSWVAGGTNILNVNNVSAGLLAANSLNMSNGGILTSRGTWSPWSLTFVAGTGTVERLFGGTISSYGIYNNLILGNFNSVSCITNFTINGNLTIRSGTNFIVDAYTLTVGGTTTVNGGLTITSATGAKSFGSLINNGTITNTAANVPLTINGDFQNNGTYNSGTGMVTFTGAASNTITGTAVSTDFNGGITVNKGTSQSNILDVQCIITMAAGVSLGLSNGTFKLSSASTIAPFANTAAAIIGVSTGLWNNGGTMNSPASMNWSLSGLIRCTSGTINVGTAVDNGLLLSSGCVVTIEGGLVSIAGRFSSSISVPITFNMSGGRLNVCTAGSTSSTLYPFNINNTGTSFTWSGGTIVINQSGNPGTSNHGYYNIAATYNVTGGTLQIGSGLTPASTVIHLETTVPIYNLLVDGTNATARVYVNSIIVLNNVDITTGTLNANNLDITLGGNWTNSSAFTATIASVIFNGTGTKTLGGSTVTAFYNLRINTSALSDIVQLTKNAGVTSVLTLTQGVLDLNSKVMYITNSSNAAIVRTSGYILSEKTDNSSKVCWTVSNSAGMHTYPFGTVGGVYIPFMLTRTDGNLGTVTVSTYPTAVNNTPYPVAPEAVTNMYGSTGADNSANVVDRFWQIDKAGAVGQATFTFTATPAEMGSILLPTAQRYESSTNKWQAPLPGQTSTATTATVTGVTTFSPWTLSSQAALLPIQLVSFNAVYANPFVSLTWVTQSEINSDYFAIERTTDESSFETICEVKAAGESKQTLNYQTTDKNPSPGLSYYRLKQVDLDGTVTYSDFVAIEITSVAGQISVFPNPVTNGLVTIQIPDHPGETLHISVTDLNGKILFANTSKLGEADESSIVIDRLDNLPKGFYILTISGATDIYSQNIAIY